MFISLGFQFINPTVAAAFCEEEVIHGGVKLTLHQLERTGTVVPLEESRIILVGNLPTFFDQVCTGLLFSVCCTVCWFVVSSPMQCVLMLNCVCIPSCSLIS